jgi:hypothetical protein
VLVEKKDLHGGRQQTQNLVPLLRLDLLLAESLGVPDIRDDDKLKGDIMSEPLLIVLNELLQTRVNRFPYAQ